MPRPRPRAPWWMFLAAASYLVYVGLIIYQGIAGPAQPEGIEARFEDGRMALKSVLPHSFAEQMGLRPGDQVLAVDGQAIRNVRDWQAIRANTEAGRPQEWEVLRAGKRFQLTRTPPRGFWGSVVPLGVAYLAVVLITSTLGLFIAFSRPFDPAARVGAWVIATAAIAYGVPDGWAVTWRRLPVLVGLLLWFPQISRFVIDGILFTFFAIFPRRLFSARWPWIVVWTPVVLGLPWRMAGMYSVIYRPGELISVPQWVSSAIFLRTVVYLAGGLAALVVNYRRLEDVNQRRRTRVVVVGVAVSLLVAISYTTIESWHLAVSSGVAVSITLFVLYLAFPLSFAYAILRHRLFDIRVMVRQGLQYALARRVVLSVVPALAAVLLLDLFLHGDQPLVAILTARGWVYAALGGLALLAHARRQEWLKALDRRFFRERYDAQGLLRQVAEEIRQAGSFEGVAPIVVGRIEAALHPEFAALLVREPRELSYRTLAAAPSGHAPPPMPAESKLMALVRVLGKPLEVSLTESAWLKQQLPHEETDFLRQARIDLLVPIAIGAERTEALLVLGFKRSEEPYSREDQDLLVAIAASLALLLERAVAPVPQAGPAPALLKDGARGETFEECPQCGTCYDTGSGHCPQEGASLVPMRLPRMLAGRYRLGKRRGRGGMGTVYEATDTALERRVAAKVIREDLVGSAEAAERFRREARAAASFTHPNVVTVHDFGLVADARAFLVMELLEGTTLREELRQQKRLAAPRTIEILRGVCAGVDAAHRRQLIHRDLKPENIFLVRAEATEIPKVLDFGIAKFLPAATQETQDTGTGLLVGTVRYMAPEQLRAEPVDAAWDLWALAVVAYEMLTGAQPFAGTTAAECHNAVLAGRFTPLAQHLPESPARWREFFARAFALDRDQRPSSAPMFFSELQRALS